MTSKQELKKLQQAFKKAKAAPQGGGSKYGKLPEGRHEVVVLKGKLEPHKFFKDNPLCAIWELEITSGDAEGKRGDLTVDLQTAEWPSGEPRNGMAVLKREMTTLEMAKEAEEDLEAAMLGCEGLCAVAYVGRSGRFMSFNTLLDAPAGGNSKPAPEPEGETEEADDDDDWED